MNRQGSIELLRVIVMLLIVSTHLVVWGIGKYDNAAPWQMNMSDIINAAIRWHVNVFVLISGYFGIKSQKGVVRIICLSFFYSVLLYALECFFVSGTDFSIFSFVKLLFMVSHSKYWFVQTYVFLALLAPMLNLVMQSRYSRRFALVLLFIDCWCGWFHNPSISNGFGVLHFMTLYVIGGGIRHYDFSKYRGYVKMIFILSLLLLVARQILLPQLIISNGYNDPLLIAASASILIWFSGIEMKCNSLLQLFSQCSFSVYLIHDSGFGHFYLKKSAQWLCESTMPNEYLLFVLLFVLLTFIVYAVCSLADMILRNVYNPIIDVILQKSKL